MSERITDLETVVRKAVAPVLETGRVSSVEVRPDWEDDDRIVVTVHVAKSKERLPGDVLLRIVNAASDAIAETGERRFPLVFGRFAEMQEFAAA